MRRLSGALGAVRLMHVNPETAVPLEKSLVEGEPEAMLHLQDALRSGACWYEAMLEAMALWTLPEEVYRDREYRYLVQGEAFDWLVLAERLCAGLELAGLAHHIPAEERERLLFHGRLPAALGPERFRELLGGSKYPAYLNFWYGVVVEEALQLAVEEDVRKRHLARCYADSEDLVEEAFTHLYGDTRSVLIQEFRALYGVGQDQKYSLSDVKRFTYWLFKRRVDLWDPARVASDTRKGIRRLQQLEQVRDPGLEFIEV